MLVVDDGSKAPPAYDVEACPWLDLESPLTLWEWSKLLLLFPLGLLRTVWMVVTWVSVGFLSWLMCLGVADDQPMPPLRNGASCCLPSSFLLRPASLDGDAPC